MGFRLFLFLKFLFGFHGFHLKKKFKIIQHYLLSFRAEENLAVNIKDKGVKSRNYRANIFIDLLDHAYEVLLANIQRQRQRWPEKHLIWGGLEPSM